MPEKINLVTKNPQLAGSNNDYMILGKLEARGDEFIVFIGLNTGKVHIEEAFATQVLGQFVVGLKLIEDDTMWNSLVYAANSYGITQQKHILWCLKKLGIKVKPKDLSTGKVL